jgi:DNA-binding transcriptional ArsR family regulator
MTDEVVSTSPLENVSDAAGPNATEAFSVLGNETRLAILLALWEELDPFSEHPTDATVGDAVPFSKLRKRVGMPDGSQFNYHLSRLVGRFVRKSDEGYELTTAGEEVVRTIIATAGFDRQTTEPVEISEPCPFCGAPSAVTYRNYRLYQLCTECPGNFSTGGEHPEGVINAWKSSPALLNHGSAEEIFHASTRDAAHRYALRYEGVCDKCSGPVTPNLHVCEDHDSPDEETCPNCDRRFEVGCRFVCSTCKAASICPLLKAVLVPHHPEIDEFLVRHGVVPEFPYLTEIPELETEESVVSTDPLRVRVTLDIHGERLELLLDEHAGVVEATG